MDVRHDERHSAVDKRSEVCEVGAERRARLTLGAAVGIQDRRSRSADPAWSVHKARDVAVGARYTDQLRLDELALGNGERRAERNPRVTGRGVECPHLPRLDRRQPRECGA